MLTFDFSQTNEDDNTDEDNNREMEDYIYQMEDYNEPKQENVDNLVNALIKKFPV